MRRYKMIYKDSRLQRRKIEDIVLSVDNVWPRQLSLFFLYLLSQVPFTFFNCKGGELACFFLYNRLQ